MFGHSPINLLKRRYKLVVLVGLFAATLSLLASFIFPLEYRADAQVLIISKSRSGVDPYTVVKSAERVAENIVAVMRTDDFYKKVVFESGRNLDTSRFDAVSERKKRKLWQKTLQTSVVYGTGVLNISAYHPSPAEAKRFASAAADTLAAKGWEYIGGDVTIKVVNEPVVSRFPVRPNLLINILAGFVAGIIVMGGLIIKRHR
jgi:capsular polysaccharide biosynthesis protein